MDKKLPVEVHEKDIKDDYEFSRDTYKELVDIGLRSIDVLAELARESEHPRAFEVLAKSIKDVGDVTEKLMALQKTNRDLKKDDGEDGPKRITNNNVFVGSTTDLQKMLHSNEKVINAEPSQTDE